MPHATSLIAPAKVNLGLEILRKRPDGYHDLETVFYRIALADEIEIHDRPDGRSMECSDPGLPLGPENLCLRAAAAVQEAAAIQRGVHIVLRKRIPTGAGLGGGSSDAAAVLAGLTERWSAGLNAEELRRLGATLGSDVPAFLGGPLSFGSGRGEILEDLPPRFPYWLVCVTPPVSVSTAWAYGHLTLRPRVPGRSVKDRFLSALTDPRALASVLTNDFEESVLAAYPVIAEVKRALLQAGCFLSLMSGSGSSVFGVTERRERAEAALRPFAAHMTTSLTPPLG